MELISQKTKALMEECKSRARDAGLIFDKESIEYIVTNQDMIGLSPKNMIPTLYDYWVQDIDIAKGKGVYSIYPSNPYETVINTRPPISFYNDNNPDWLNIMIFYHVIAHIDFFQNNIFFERTWDDDFCGRALSSKERIDEIRRELGENKRELDYVIEWARSLDNITGFTTELNQGYQLKPKHDTEWNFFFNAFCRKKGYRASSRIDDDIAEFNRLVRLHGEQNGEEVFFQNLKKRFPEFEENFRKYRKNFKAKEVDLLDYLLAESVKLNSPENEWKKEVINIVRETALYFAPQIRTKILNEGWASYWHQKLFLLDERIRGNEVNYARINSGVMSVPKAGLNPYAIGYLLYEYIYEMAEKGRLDHCFDKENDIEIRRSFDLKSGKGLEKIFWVRQYLDDSGFLNFLVPKDFQDFVTRNKLRVVGKRFNEYKQKVELYVASKKGEDYRNMILNQLYHPPHIRVVKKKSKNGVLILEHVFEGKPLIEEYIRNVLFYIEKMWGQGVKLVTHDLEPNPAGRDGNLSNFRKRKVLYSMINGNYEKKVLGNE